jgi:hypothetical protein
MFVELKLVSLFVKEAGMNMWSLERERALYALSLITDALDSLKLWAFRDIQNEKHVNARSRQYRFYFWLREVSFDSD